MRIALLVAASALVAACSSGADRTAGQPESSSTSPRASSSATLTTSAPTSTTAPVAPTSAPRAGAPIADVVAFVEAGRAAEASNFHTATRDGVATDLGGDVAFVSGTANCMTDHRFDGALACLVDLADPPPQPADVYGQWKGNWVDFEGASAEVGSAHGDPGRFGTGTGPELTAGQAVAFGDYRCRAEAAAVYCVNYAHQSAIKFSSAGIEPFGCLQRVPAPPDIGIKFSCGT